MVTTGYMILKVLTTFTGIFMVSCIFCLHDVSNNRYKSRVMITEGISGKVVKLLPQYQFIMHHFRKMSICYSSAQFCPAKQFLPLGEISSSSDLFCVEREITLFRYMTSKQGLLNILFVSGPKLNCKGFSMSSNSKENPV